MSCNCNETYEVTEDSTFVLLARVRLTTGELPTLADIQSMTFSLFDTTEDSEGDQVGTVQTIDKEDHFIEPNEYGVIPTDLDWAKKKDSAGYNIQYATSVPDAGKQYRAEIFITFDNGHTRKLKWTIRGN